MSQEYNNVACFKLDNINPNSVSIGIGECLTLNATNDVVYPNTAILKLE